MDNTTVFTCKNTGTVFRWTTPVLYFGEQTEKLSTDDWSCQENENAKYFQWRSKTAKKIDLRSSWICKIEFADLQCDQLLINHDSMGGCRVFTRQMSRREFVSSNILMLRRGNEFVSLNFSADVAGELFWCGVWENGSVSQLRAEVRERFASRDAWPEIAIEIRTGSNPNQLLVDWVTRQYPERKMTPVVQSSAWSSWDYYRWSVTAEDVLANAEFIARDPILSQHIKRIVIDDGWMNCYGEWEPNSRFSDLAGLVKELHKMHFSAGLWFAPGIAEPQSMLAQKHWEWLARGENNWPCLAYECMSRRGFLLDPTRKEVQKYLYELFLRYKGMGVDYFKLDFLKHTLNARKFYDKKADANEIIRSLLRPIRQAVGKNTILMGCNYLFNAGNEYLDIVRCASDIHADFASIKENSTSIAVRLPFHNRVWINDPDFALIRGYETSDDPEMDLLRPNQVYINAAADKFDDFCGKWCCAGAMSRREAEILLSLVLISGGEMTFSDALHKLNPTGIDLVRKAASAPRGSAGTADDLLSGEYAQKFTQQVSNAHWRKLWINWQDENQTLKLTDLPENTVRLNDFWSDKKLCKDQTVIIPGKSCLLLDIYL